MNAIVMSYLMTWGSENGCGTFKMISAKNLFVSEFFFPMVLCVGLGSVAFEC